MPTMVDVDGLRCEAFDLDFSYMGLLDEVRDEPSGIQGAKSHE